MADKLHSYNYQRVETYIKGLKESDKGDMHDSPFSDMSEEVWWELCEEYRGKNGGKL